MIATDLTAVNAFAGIGGFDRALAEAGVRTVAAIEIDPAPRGVLADQFPDTALFSDICEVIADDLLAAGFVPERGVFTAGWPCQDLSVAGRRLGLGGARSGLFWEVIRLLKQLRSKWFILENVPGLLSAVCSCPGLGYCGGYTTWDEGTSATIFHACDDPHLIRGGACGFDGTRGHCMELHGGAMGAVLGALVELGYGVAYRVLDAQHFGVPQRRRRVVFVGCLGDWAAPAQVLLEPEGGAGDSAPRRASGSGPSAVAALSASNGGADENDATGGRLIAGTLGSRVGGSRTTDLDGHGAYVVGALTAGASSRAGWRMGPDEAAVGHLVPTVSAKWAKGTGGPAGDETQNLVVAATLTAGSHKSQVPGRRREDDENIVVAPALTARYAKGTDSDATDGLLPVAPYSISDHANPVVGRDQIGALQVGTGAVPAIQVVGPLQTGHTPNGHGMAGVNDQHAASGHLLPIAFDWQSDGSDRVRGNISTERTSALGTTNRDAVAEASAVRRLTPVECERLQGYSDGWTATSWGKPQSDSARYRELGNSVAVPVFTWVARRTVAVDSSMRAALS